MKKFIETEIVKAATTGLAIDTGLWTDAYKSDATRRVAATALETVTARLERLLHIYHARYGVDLEYTRVTELVGMFA